MSAYRFYNPAPVMHDLLGLKPLAGGSLRFYEIGTTTPKVTWANAEMTIPNENPVPLDSAGRVNTNIWCDGAYSVALFANDGSQVTTSDINSGAGSGASIPPLLAGRLLGNDGVNVFWQNVLQIPDPTDSANYILATDGFNLNWVPPPQIPELPIENNSGRVKIGAMMIQWGSGAIAPSGYHTAAANASFVQAFSDIPIVMAISNSATTSVEGQVPTFSVIERGLDGFTVQISSNDYGRTGALLTKSTPYSWVAFGPVAA